jgi:hypothetical protein
MQSKNIIYIFLMNVNAYTNYVKKMGFRAKNTLSIQLDSVKFKQITGTKALFLS